MDYGGHTAFSVLMQNYHKIAVVLFSDHYDNGNDFDHYDNGNNNDYYENGVIYTTDWIPHFLFCSTFVVFAILLFWCVIYIPDRISHLPCCHTFIFLAVVLLWM